MRSLRWKLGLALLLVVAISVGLTAFLTNRSTTSEFASYMEQSRQNYVELAGEALPGFTRNKAIGPMYRTYLMGLQHSAETGWFW